MTTVESVRKGVIDGSVKTVQKTVQEALDAGTSAKDVLTDGLIAAMAEVGSCYESGEFFVPDMLLAARAMKAGLEILKPRLVNSDVKPIGKVAVGTVTGDLHDIGKNLVAMMLEGAGFEIVDLGVDVAAEKYVAAVRGGAQIVAISALLTTTMPNMKGVVEALKAAGLRDKVTIVVGGAPITQGYADAIGADGYAPDASNAVHKVRQLIGA
ncbi:MAG: corrinoid protein [Anaerolineae bacterium]|nr:corrinoid protein [Anaerolineae bacterium]